MSRVLEILDLVTKLDHGPITVHVHLEALETYSRIGTRVDDLGHGRSVVSGPRTDLETTERIQRANRYISTRRYAVANQLDAMITLTAGAPSVSRAALTAETTNAFRRAKRLSGFTFPFIWVVEGGWPDCSDGHQRAHVHALVPHAATPPLMATWFLGDTNVTVLSGTDQIRRAARYITKALPPGKGRLIHTCPGFKPKPQLYALPSSESLSGFVIEKFGGPPDQVIRPDERAPQCGLSFLWLSSEK